MVGTEAGSPPVALPVLTAAEADWRQDKVTFSQYRSHTQ